MNIYKSIMEFTDGRTITDLWSDKEGAVCYIENSPNFEGIVRSELFEYVSDGLMYKPENCLFEYDANGNYYYNTEATA